ncbi:MAG: hypothetical protein JEZ11_01880 [Desulfobacterales bacterium]|nr:hypothetical protein [Desulfobacterales bacterium]
MKTTHKILLAVDGGVNVILGVLLMLFPVGIVDLLGLPPTDTHFYPSIFGAVLLGIGIALLAEIAGSSGRFRGLGLGGAIIINICGSVALILWLVFGALEIPLRGQILLWVIGVLVLGIGLAEILARSWTYDP